MFENLSSGQKALLARALNTELNAIARLYMSASSSKQADAMRQNFKEQHATVFYMWDAIYPITNHIDTPESDLEARTRIQGVL